ncbi:MAG: hypothetical protein FK733_16295 [Asgard group archaeon]|nr:hypothetical protein [Asgard group archaeon]
MLQFLIISLMILVAIVSTILYQLPAIKILAMGFDQPWNYVCFLIFNFNQLIEIILLSTSLLIFGITIRKGNKRKYWSMKPPITTIILFVISLFLTCTFVMALVEMFKPSTIFYFPPLYEDPILYRVIIAKYFEYTYQFNFIIYGLMGLIAMLELTIRTRKIYQLTT